MTSSIINRNDMVLLKVNSSCGNSNFLFTKTLFHQLKLQLLCRGQPVNNNLKERMKENEGIKLVLFIDIQCT